MECTACPCRSKKTKATHRLPVCCFGVYTLLDTRIELRKAPLQLLKFVLRKAPNLKAFSATNVDSDRVAEDSGVHAEASDVIDMALPEDRTEDAFHTDKITVYLYLGTLPINEAGGFELHRTPFLVQKCILLRGIDQSQAYSPFDGSTRISPSASAISRCRLRNNASSFRPSMA